MSDDASGRSHHFYLLEDHALDLDGKDPLARFRDRFHHPKGPGGEELVYLAGNSLGLQPKEAMARVAREMEAWAALALGGHFREADPWYTYHETLAPPLARLAGALPGEVVAMNSLTVNLHLMMATFYRPEAARAAILMEERPFPSDHYAAASQIRARGFDPAKELILARARPGESFLRTLDLEALLRQEGKRIALVLLAGVNFVTGQFFDVRKITACAREQGCVVGVDLAHAIGNVPLQLHDWGVDFAVWCSYKYLNGGPGTVGGCFVHERHGGDLTLPRLAGWWGNDPATRFRMEPEFVPRSGADGWQLSNPPILAMAPLRAALELFEEAGMEALRKKSIALTGYLETLLERFEPSFCDVITPRDPAARGCQLSLRFPRQAREIQQALEQAGFVTDFREPDVIRVTPVPLYIRYHDVWRFSRTLEQIASSPLPGA